MLNIFIAVLGESYDKERESLICNFAAERVMLPSNALNNVYARHELPPEWKNAGRGIYSTRGQFALFVAANLLFGVSAWERAKQVDPKIRVIGYRTPRVVLHKTPEAELAREEELEATAEELPG